jgi:cytidylate kinase
LTVEEARERVKMRDERRTEFILNNFQRDPNEVHQYDLILNSSLLGEDVSAELIAQAARARAAQLQF